MDDPAGRARFAAEPTSPRPRRLTAPRWLDVRLAMGIALVLGSVLAGARLISDANRTYPKLAARHDLAAGTILSAGDLTIARVRLPADGAHAYISRASDAIGKQLEWAVATGELLPAGALGVLPPRTTVTVPLATGASPELRKGERIELWVSTSSCPSTVLLPDVAVQSVRADPDGSFGSGTDGQDVVISVPPELADRVVQALTLDQSELRAGILVGAGSQGGGALPDLSSCVKSSR